MYGTPFYPTLPGEDTFKGDVMHSTYYTDASISKGKKTIVVGAGKSGIDCTVASYHEGGEPPLLLYRQFHWPVPRYLANILPFKWGTYTRFGHFMLQKYHSLGFLKNTAHVVATPLKWVWWRIVELMVRIQFRMGSDLTPDYPY